MYVKKVNLNNFGLSKDNPQGSNRFIFVPFLITYKLLVIPLSSLWIIG